MKKNKKRFTVGAAEFKTHCLRILEEVKDKHVSVIITKHGKIIAELHPYIDKPVSLFGCLKDSLVINGDIIQGTGEKWDAESD